MTIPTLNKSPMRTVPTLMVREVPTLNLSRAAGVGERWVTIDGEHVLLNKSTGNIVAGPKSLEGKNVDHLPPRSGKPMSSEDHDKAADTHRAAAKASRDKSENDKAGGHARKAKEHDAHAAALREKNGESASSAKAKPSTAAEHEAKANEHYEASDKARLKGNHTEADKHRDIGNFHSDEASKAADHETKMAAIKSKTAAAAKGNEGLQAKIDATQKEVDEIHARNKAHGEKKTADLKGEVANLKDATSKMADAHEAKANSHYEKSAKARANGDHAEADKHRDLGNAYSDAADSLRSGATASMPIPKIAAKPTATAAKAPVDNSPEAIRQTIRESVDKHAGKPIPGGYGKAGAGKEWAPIHLVRQDVAAKHGAAAASHAVFDEHAFDAWREGKGGILPVSDGRDTTPETRESGIPRDENDKNSIFGYLSNKGPKSEPAPKVETKPAAPSTGTAPTDADIHAAIKSNIKGDHERAMATVHDVRKSIESSHGKEFAGEHLSKRLKSMRGDSVDLISPFDYTSHANEVNESGVKGAGETFTHVKMHKATDFSHRNLSRADIPTLNLDRSSEPLTGGNWKTINGSRVYIHSGTGEILAGGGGLKGKNVKDLAPHQKPMGEDDHRAAAKQHKNDSDTHHAAAEKIAKEGGSVAAENDHRQKAAASAAKAAKHEFQANGLHDANHGGGRSAPVPVDEEVKAAIASGKIAVPTLNGKVDPHLEEAIRRHAAEQGHNVGSFDVDAKTGTATASLEPPVMQSAHAQAMQAHSKATTEAYKNFSRTFDEKGRNHPDTIAARDKYRAASQAFEDAKPKRATVSPRKPIPSVAPFVPKAKESALAVTADVPKVEAKENGKSGTSEATKEPPSAGGMGEEPKGTPATRPTHEAFRAHMRGIQAKNPSMARHKAYDQTVKEIGSPVFREHRGLTGATATQTASVPKATTEAGKAHEAEIAAREIEQKQHEIREKGKAARHKEYVKNGRGPTGGNSSHYASGERTTTKKPVPIRKIRDDIDPLSHEGFAAMLSRRPVPVLNLSRPRIPTLNLSRWKTPIILLSMGEEFTGGAWRTINGARVYIKDGKAIAGPSHLKHLIGKSEKEIDEAGPHNGTQRKSPVAANKSESSLLRRLASGRREVAARTSARKGREVR